MKDRYVDWRTIGRYRFKDRSLVADCIRMALMARASSGSLRKGHWNFRFRHKLVQLSSLPEERLSVPRNLKLKCHLAPRSKKEYSSSSTPSLGLHGLFQGEVSFMNIYLQSKIYSELLVLPLNRREAKCLVSVHVQWRGLLHDWVRQQTRSSHLLNYIARKHKWEREND
jgi:hypothetical protein